MRPTQPRLQRTRLAPLAAALLLVASAAPPARAADNNNDAKTITVTGSGEAKGRPTIVEMGATVSGEAELAADAVVKYKDARRRAVKAVEDLKIPSLTIDSKGFTLSQGVDANQQQMMMRGQMVTTAKQRVLVTEPLRLVIRGVDKMKDEELMNTVLKLIDAGRDAGLVIGPAAPQNYYQMQMMMQRGDTTGPGLASFKIEDPAAVREEAYAKAVENARAKAGRIAKLAGVKLGRVTSVSDGAPPTNNPVVYASYYMGQQAGGEPELSSAVAGDITLTVRLTVQFAIE
jgi:uncharacterized protein YggE